MRHIHNLWSMFAAIMTIVFCASLPASAHEDPPQMEVITLTVEVLAESDDPVPGVPLRVDSSVRMHFGITDEDGKLTLDITRQVGEDFLASRPSSGLFLWENDEQKEEAIERFHLVRKQYSFDQTTFIQLDGEGPAYSGVIRAYDSVVVRGRLVAPDSAPIFDGALGAPPQVAYAFTDEDGEFELKGVRKGSAAEILVEVGLSEIHSMLMLSAIQLQTDVDLGDIVIQDSEADSTLTLSIVDQGGVELRSKVGTKSTVVIVDEDGNKAHSFDVSASGVAFLLPGGGEIRTAHPIPSGVWYATVGAASFPPGLMLRQALREGKAAELEAAGVPKIVVPPGEHVEFTFSATDAWNALKSVVPEP